jgi:hypothetical protein
MERNVKGLSLTFGSYLYIHEGMLIENKKKRTELMLALSPEEVFFYLSEWYWKSKLIGDFAWLWLDYSRCQRG